jgi:hypothetical protein
VLKTKIFLGGLNIDFYKIGVGNPTEAGSPSASQLDADCSNFGATDYGCGNPDYLALAGEFVGTVDFASLFALLGGISLSPGLEVVSETYLGLPDEVRARLGGKGGITNGRLDLTPRESWISGFGKGAQVLLDGTISFLPREEVRDKIRFTYRLDGGIWHPYRPGDTWIEPPDLPDGRHVLEVRAKGVGDIVDLTPAELIFYVDHQPPDLRVFSEEGRFVPPDGTIRTASLRVVARDNISEPEALDLKVRVDGGPWKALRRDRLSLAEYGEGLHTVEISAVDEFNLERRVNLSVVVPTPQVAGWGCTLSRGRIGGIVLPFLFLAFGALLLRLRRGRSDLTGDPPSTIL